MLNNSVCCVFHFILTNDNKFQVFIWFNWIYDQVLYYLPCFTLMDFLIKLLCRLCFKCIYRSTADVKHKIILELSKDRIKKERKKKLSRGAMIILLFFQVNFCSLSLLNHLFFHCQASHALLKIKIHRCGTSQITFFWLEVLERKPLWI